MFKRLFLVCILLGFCHAESVKEWALKVIPNLEKQCNGGDANACAELSLIYINEFNESKKSLLALEKACHLGMIDKCSIVADRYKIGMGVKKDPKIAYTLYKIACDNGDFMSCYTKSLMCDNGEGTKKDSIKANELLHKSCKLGFAMACHNIGARYESGTNAQKDIKKAKMYYQLACELKDSNGCKKAKSLE